MARHLRILLAHDSPAEAVRLRLLLEAEPGLAVADTAADLTRTYDLAEHRLPDAVLIGESLLAREEALLLLALLKALGIGCVVVANQAARAGSPAPTGALLPRLAGGSAVGVAPRTADGPHLAGALRAAAARPGPGPAAPSPDAAWAAAGAPAFDPRRIVLIGASTGGIEALMTVLGDFPAACPPTAIVQHTGADFSDGLVRLLDRHVAPRVVRARDGLAMTAGQIVLAGGDTHHLELRNPGAPRCILQDRPRVSGHRPSIDALFHSATPLAAHVSAALLTGMGRDGA